MENDTFPAYDELLENHADLLEEYGFTTEDDYWDRVNFCINYGQLMRDE